MSTNQVNLLLSGGIDSTAALSYYKEMGNQVNAFFVHYGNVANDVEFKHAQIVSRYYSTKLYLLKFTGANYGEKWEITGRNAFLILSVLIADQTFTGIISLGIHKGSNYYDCNEEFINTMRALIDGYTDGSVQLDFPFSEMTKNEIVAYCKWHKVPLEDTFSCQVGEDVPCEKCPSCVERNDAIESAKLISGEDK